MTMKRFLVALVLGLGALLCAPANAGVLHKADEAFNRSVNEALYGRAVVAQLTTLGVGGGFTIPNTYVANAVAFNGSTQSLTLATNFTGAADSATGILSMWLKINGGDSTTMSMLRNTSGFVDISRSSANKFNFMFMDSTGLLTFNFGSVATYATSTTWLNVLSSWDVTLGVGSKVSNLYVNNVSDKTVIADATLGFNVDYTSGAWGAMAAQNASQKFNGCEAEIYFAPGKFLDFTIAGNRAKFIDGNGKPVSLGADGSTPTGTAPILYLPNAFGTVGANAGTGGNMTANSSPTACSTGPSSWNEFSHLPTYANDNWIPITRYRKAS